MLESNATTVGLGQGISNDIVASFTNNLQVKCSMEVYEYTASNLTYSMSLDDTSNSSFFCTHIYGKTSDSHEPMKIFLPKIKIIKGFTRLFENTAASNVPFEFTLHEPDPRDASYNPDFAQRFVPMQY